MAHIMATGYVHELIDKDLDFPTFAMRCARAFGALILMRDDPNDAPIPDEFTPSEHHVTELAKAKTELAELLAMNESQRLAYGESAKREKIEMLMASQRDVAADVAKCLATLEAVKHWTPPTPDHEGLKKFMVEQIEQSVDPKRGTFYDDEIAKSKSVPPASYWEKAVESCRWAVSYHEKEKAEEIRRAAERTAWVKKLRESLAGAR